MSPRMGRSYHSFVLFSSQKAFLKLSWISPRLSAIAWLVHDGGTGLGKSVEVHFDLLKQDLQHVIRM